MVVQKPFNVGGLYKLESNYGTGVTPDTPIGRLNSIGITVNNNPIKVRALGAGRNVSSSLFGNLDVRFNWEQDLHDGGIFSLIIGPRTGSGTVGSKYVFAEATKVAAADLPFFTLEASGKDTTDEGLQATGCVVDSVTLSFAVNSVAKLSVSGVAQTVANITSAQTYTEVSTKPWVFYQLTMNWGSGPSALGRVISGSVTMNNNLVAYRTLGSRTIVQPEIGVHDYTFSVTCYLSETSYETMRLSLYGGGALTSPSNAVASAAFPTTDKLQLAFSEGGSSGNRNLLVQLSEAVLDSLSEPVSVGNGLVQVTFTGHAHAGTSNQPVTYWTV